MRAQKLAMQKRGMMVRDGETFEVGGGVMVEVICSEGKPKKPTRKRAAKKKAPRKRAPKKSTAKKGVLRA